MHVPKIDARYVHMKDAEVRLTTYHDGTTALIASDTDEDGMPDEMTFSVNLAAYDLVPDEGFVYIKDDAECEGLAKALEELGIVEIVESVTYGPFRVRADLVKVTLS